VAADVFRKEVERLMIEAKERGCEYIDITSKEVHTNVGGYPGKNHNMPSCCDVMYSMRKKQDEVLEAPPKGKGASLKIRYFL